jgi:hypothetical protein
MHLSNNKNTIKAFNTRKPTGASHKNLKNLQLQHCKHCEALHTTPHPNYPNTHTSHLKRVRSNSKHQQPFLPQQAHKGCKQQDFYGQATGGHDLQEQGLVCASGGEKGVHTD